MKFRVQIELEKISGAEQNKDTLIDYFAGQIGRENAAKQPLQLTIYGDGEVAAVYGVKSVDDA